VIPAPQTERLVAERVHPDHHEALVALLGDPRVGATLGGALDGAGVAAALASTIEHWERHGFGYWIWRERATGDVVARGGLQHTSVGGPGAVEVGWAVMADRWGEGFASELGAASVRVGFDRLGLPGLVSYTLPDNLASRRVMEKLGFAYAGAVEHAGLAHVLYRLRAPRAVP
jgi:ribosomal-protein-alanine N-acetyltransferase